MNIKSSQQLVKEAQKNIETLNSDEIKKLLENNEITLIDVRDIRELWKEGTIENSIHIPRGMLEFWLDPESTYYQNNKIQNIKKNGFILCTWMAVRFSNKIPSRNGFQKCCTC